MVTKNYIYWSENEGLGNAIIVIVDRNTSSPPFAHEMGWFYVWFRLNIKFKSI
jgi:hypothetical protein